MDIIKTLDQIGKREREELRFINNKSNNKILAALPSRLLTGDSGQSHISSPKRKRSHTFDDTITPSAASYPCLNE
jgi:hypothetical protein